MKRILVVLALVLGSAVLYAQEKPKMMDMSGTICDSKCVTQDAGKSSCDLSCTQKSDDAVFVDDNGKATKIANPGKVKGYMGKHVKAKCKMDEDKGLMWIQSLSIYG